MEAKLWKGNGCTDKALAVVRRDTPRLSDSDDARSLTFKGRRGSVLSVYDKDSYQTSDDWAVIVKTDDQDVCVRTFESRPISTWNTERGYKIYYSGGSNLDGKVTSLRFSSPIPVPPI